MKKLYALALGLLAVNAAMALPAQSRSAADDMESIIFEAPDGAVKYYNMKYSGWVYWGASMGFHYFDNSSTVNEIVWADNNEVYIKSPLGTQGSNTYLKGEYVDSQVRVQLPQCIGSYYNSETANYEPVYLNVLEEVEAERDGELGRYYMIVDPENDHLVYDVDSEGNLTLMLGNTGSYDTANGVNPPFVVGTTYSNEPHAFQVWSGYGDTFQTWSLINNPDPVCPPESATIEYWGFDTRGTKSLIKVAIDGDDIYIDGFTSYIQGYWIKGHKADGKIIFPTKQYMGMNQYKQFYYFRACRIIFGTDGGWNTYEEIDEVTMNLDPETGIYSAPDEAFMVTTSLEGLSFTALAESPMLWQQTPEKLNAAPNDPVFKSHTAFDASVGKGSVAWDIPNQNVNGALLNEESMYYNLYVDGELYTFWPDQYPLFEEPTENVPYKASNFYNIYVYKTTHTIYYYFSDVESFGLQSVYVAEDGTEYKSNLVTQTFETDGAKALDSEKVATNVTYTNLQGIMITNPTNGMYIKTTIYADGSRKVEKVAIR